jgi:hypothetical protein
MEAPATTTFSHCQVCRQKLEHTTLFCPRCRVSTCCWECYTHHLASHVHQPIEASSRGPSLAAVKRA